MKIHTVQPRQSLFDVAVMAYGDVSGVAFILADNPDLGGPTARLRVGQLIRIRDEVVNQRARIYLQDYPVIATIEEADRPQGVGFWRLDEHLVASPELNIPPPEPF